MRKFIIGSMLLATAFGCASDKNDQTTKTSTSHAAKTADLGACALQSGGRDVLQVAVDGDAKCEAKEGTLHLESRQRGAVNIWLVKGAKNVDDAAARARDVIKPEFTDFKSATTSNLTVAGAPAKRLLGAGTEADDSDPGTADVVVFTAGGRVFIACVHGENLAPTTQQWMMTLLQTAHAP